MLFPRVLNHTETPTASFRIVRWLVESISDDENHEVPNANMYNIYQNENVIEKHLFRSLHS